MFRVRDLGFQWESSLRVEGSGRFLPSWGKGFSPLTSPINIISQNSVSLNPSYHWISRARGSGSGSVWAKFTEPEHSLDWGLPGSCDKLVDPSF